MTSVPLAAQISRIAQRVTALERFLRVCPESATVTIAEKRQELSDYQAVLATLIAERARGDMEGHDPDPFDPQYYEPYSEWLMKNYAICNGDDLVRHLERGDGFEQFLRETK